MLKFHVALTPLMLISNGFESSPELAGDDGAFSLSVTDSPSSLLWMDDPSLVLLLLCLFRNYEEKDGNGNQLHLQLPTIFFSLVACSVTAQCCSP